MCEMSRDDKGKIVEYLVSGNRQIGELKSYFLLQFPIRQKIIRNNFYY